MYALKMALYGPDDATVLTPAAGAPHGDKFLVASCEGVSDGLGTYRPFLEARLGHNGKKLDLITKRVSTGTRTCRIFDLRTETTSEVRRWLTSFTGDALGAEQLKGLLRKVWESFDVELGAAATWTLVATERCTGVEYDDDTLWPALTFADTSDELNRAQVFGGPPRSTITYAVRTQLWPPGLTGAYGPYAATPPLKGKYIGDPGSTGERYVDLDADQVQAARNLIPDSLRTAVQGWGAVEGGWLPFLAATLSGRRVRLKRLDTSATGEFGLRFVNGVRRADGHFAIARLSLVQLTASDPAYLAYPPTNTAVEVAIVGHGETGADNGLFLNDQHPLQVFKDLCAGAFGLLQQDGTPWRTHPVDSAAFATLIADTSFGVCRFPITRAAKAREWAERELFQPHNFCYTIGADGAIVPVDLRLPASLVGLPVLTDADLREGAVPTWRSAIGTVYSQFEFALQLERQRTADETSRADSAEYPVVPPARMDQQEWRLILPNVARPRLGANRLAIETEGWRAAPGEILDGQDRRTILDRRAHARLDEERRRYSAGLYEAVLPCRRTAVTTQLRLGMWVLVQMAYHLPDPATNVRGGQRLMQVTKCDPDGNDVDIEVADAGISTVAGAPTAGTLAAETGNARHGVKVPVTLHASGAPVRVEYAVTTTSVGSRPIGGSPLWTYAGTVTASGDVFVRDVPSGSRIWPRIRSEPANTLQQPSAWVYPAANYWDTTAIGAPSGLSVSVSGVRALLSWAPADTNLFTEVRYCTPSGGTPALKKVMPPGSIRFQFDQLAGSTSHKAQVVHRDGHGGYSAVGETTFNTTTGGPAPAAAPGLVVLVGDTGFALLRALPDDGQPEDLTAGIAIGVTPADPGQPVEIEYAPDNGSGAPNTGATVTRGTRYYEEAGDPFVEVTPNDNTLRHFRGRAVPPGGSAGSWSDWVSARPAELPPWVLKRGSVYPLRRDKPLADGKHAAQADDTAGTVLGATVGQTDGTGVRSLAKGYQTGQVRNGDAVTFSPAFAAPPLVTLRGGISHEPRSKWGTTGDGTETGAPDTAKPQYDELEALNVTASGFTARARLRQKATQTAQSDEFSASNLLDAVGETTEANLDPAGATGDSYVVHYDVEIVVTAPLPGKPPNAGQIVVAIETNDGGGGGWIERAAYTYAAVNDDDTTPLTRTWTHEAKTIVVSGLGTNDDVRLRIKSASGALDSFAVHGFEGAGAGDPEHGVTYNTATDSYASKTPDTDDRVGWAAVAA